jgi:hypothetical protein
LAHFVIEAVDRVSLDVFKINHWGVGHPRYPPLDDANAANIGTPSEQPVFRKTTLGCVFYTRALSGPSLGRVYRIYCELELNLHIKPRNRLTRDTLDVLAVPALRLQRGARLSF